MAQYIERAKVTDALIDNTSIVGDELEESVNAICAIPAADVVSGSDFRDCRNELCLYCGKYKERHNGACDGCRWRADNG